MRLAVALACAAACAAAFTGCRDSAPAAARAEAQRSSAPEMPSALALTVVATDARWEARVAGDSAVRVLVTPRRDDRMTARLCGHVVTRSVAASAIPFGLPIDTTMPPLAIRLVEGDRVTGLRYLVPGAQGYYLFEGVSQEGSRRISVRWPVTSDPTRPIPAGAADSLIEAAVTPNPYMLDSAMRSMRLGVSPINRDLSALPAADSARAMAMPLVRDFPDQPLLLSDACPQATVLLPMLARIDQKLRVPVQRGDAVRARALQGEGTVQLSFDEASPAATPPTVREAIPDASFTSPDSGRVTLRVRVQVVPRVQKAEQSIVLSVGRTSARRSGGT
ncbi:hypothetical protein [Gemmatimonas groenlandica]|uniref:Uncharacterized protein n=1 Tax=Gemmatimonas groenlandica TaxID=2732249 RepID=A0A6M4IPM7_9BACT|nr:hypothetical protein [Gemmatimonas groenlandica]QJR35709.1 hypothetical protein HKW67_09390 [Gemmatimonas groenlandica]